MQTAANILWKCVYTSPQNLVIGVYTQFFGVLMVAELTGSLLLGCLKCFEFLAQRCLNAFVFRLYTTARVWVWNTLPLLESWVLEHPPTIRVLGVGTPHLLRFGCWVWVLEHHCPLIRGAWFPLRSCCNPPSLLTLCSGIHQYISPYSLSLSFAMLFPMASKLSTASYGQFSYIGNSGNGECMRHTDTIMKYVLIIFRELGWVKCNNS